jgi:putative ABC transport system substrate-binding protein
MVRKIIAFGIICFFCGGILSYAQEKEINIAVVKSLEIEPYNIALKGFKDEISKLGLKNVKYSEFLLESQSQKIDKAKIILDIKSGTSSAIVTFGSGATTFAKDNLKDKPVVFSMVLNPVASGFVSSMEANPGSNLAGSSMDIPIRKQFEVLKSISGIKRIVVIYSPKETESIVKQAKPIAEGLGLGFEAIPVNNEKEVMSSIAKLIPKQDVLWALSDSTVYTPQTIQFIILETLRNGVPFMGVAPTFVKAGALIALSCDYEGVGRQSAEIVAKIINGAKPSDIPISVPNKFDISVNASTAKRINIVLPESILKEASNIY